MIMNEYLFWHHHSSFFITLGFISSFRVLVNRRIMHPLYKKFIRRSKNYAAHDEQNLCKTGDVVRIEECRPISKRKTWLVVERNGQPLAPAAVDAPAAQATTGEAPAALA